MRTTKGEAFTELALEIFKLHGILLSEGDKISEEVGLTSARWKVLGAVVMSEEPMTVAQVAREMGLARQSVQRIADSMEGEGFFRWKDNPNHKRAKLLQQTSKGKKVFEQLELFQAPWANDASQSLELKELKNALDVLRTLVKHFDG